MGAKEIEEAEVVEVDVGVLVKQYEYDGVSDGLYVRAQEGDPVEQDVGMQVE